LGNEIQRHAVDAVALTGGGRAVGKDVAQVTAAVCAVDFRSRHPVGAIDGRADRAGSRREEARPARTGIEFRVVGEELLAAARAIEGSRTFLGIQRAAVRTLRCVLPEHLVLFRRQRLLPLLVSLLNGKVRHVSVSQTYHFDLNALPQSTPTSGLPRVPV